MGESMRRIEADNRRYRQANPWKIVNVQSPQTLCGRYPTRDAAIEAGRRYRDGIVEVQDVAQVVLVSEMPSL